MRHVKLHHWCRTRKSDELNAVFTLETASTFFDDVKEWSGSFFDAHQLGVRLNFDIDVKNSAVFDVDGTNVRMAELS